MRLNKYWLKSGKEWIKVHGFVNPKGWLEWKSRDGSQGLKGPTGYGYRWVERKKGERKPDFPTFFS